MDSKMNPTRTELLNKMREEQAEKRSKRQCSTGQPDLDKAISWYLKVGFEDGFSEGIRAADSIPDERVQGLLDAIKKSIARADDYGDSHCSQPIREALAKFKGNPEGGARE